MATILLAGDLIQMRIYTLSDNQLGVTTCDYVIANVIGVPTDAAMLLDYVNAVAPLMKGWMPQRGAYRGTEMRLWRGGIQNVPISDVTGQGDGTNPANALPLQIAGLIKKLTPLAGRKNRGRLFIPFGAVDPASPGGHPSPVQVASLLAIGQRLLQVHSYSLGLDACDFVPVLRHRVPPLTYTPLSAIAVSDKWAGQHRRGDYGKTNSSPL